ncbi:MAG: DUF1552 domain-containing protein [Acidobacteria bacterium]|nr:DUF1552 domain-containing protein [Acidobacteriota bacterium]
MMIFKKAIPRRTFLRGIGTTLALPLLDGMIPAFASALDTTKPAVRMTFVYVPNGVIMDKWAPATEGAAFELTPILEPLAPFRDRLLILSGLDNKEAWGLPGIDVTGEHPRASAAFLTGVHVDSRARELRAGISVDQIIAQEFKKHTQLASLELGIESAEILGACDGGCSYSNTICWRNATTPLPMENQPRAVFERLFGTSDSTNPAERLARIQKQASILDSVTKGATRLMAGLGVSDRNKVSQYLEAVRDIERRIQMAEEQSARELPTLQRPAGIPDTFTEHIKLMVDLQVLAYQCDLTRVSTFQIGHESSTRAYLEIGIADPHHPLTHHQGDPEKIAKTLKINILHAQMFAYFLEKMRSTPDGDGSLLDHSMIVYGSGLSDGNKHIPVNLPILLVGGGSGQIKGGRHIRYPKDTPLMNLYLTLMDKLGVPVERFGDSNGTLNLLSV